MTLKKTYFQAFAEAVAILERNGGRRLEGQHDVIYSDVEVSNTSAEDAIQLETLGWHKCSETGYWARF